jgi:signal transduction histidine kinase
MLGPIEDLIKQEKNSPMLPQLELVNRNALRLLKLVNSLLDFSKIEHGREQASFEPVDIASVTRDLTSIFRSTCERVGKHKFPPASPTQIKTISTPLETFFPTLETFGPKKISNKSKKFPPWPKIYNLMR